MDTQFKKLLNRRTSKWCESTNKEMFNDLFSLLYEWIYNQHNLIVVNDKMNFQCFFYAFICNISNDIDYYDEYMIIKYSEDIVDLFLQMKNITQSYGSFFLHEKGRTSDDLLQLIIRNVTVIDDNIIEDDLENIFNDYD
tara:strand:- start:136 stop:552 length:417 start_codon:yes stop_codon:yes gene_type:complete